MKVSELIEQLQGIDPELDVWVARDPEGSGFRRFDDAEVSLYNKAAVGSWGELEPLHPDDVEDEGLEPDEIGKVVILWP